MIDQKEFMDHYKTLTIPSLKPTKFCCIADMKAAFIVLALVVPSLARMPVSKHVQSMFRWDSPFISKKGKKSRSE